MREIVRIVKTLIGRWFYEFEGTYDQM